MPAELELARGRKRESTAPRTTIPSSSRPAFDQDTAREAWRQFARNRGARKSVFSVPAVRTWMTSVAAGTLVALAWIVWTHAGADARAPLPGPPVRAAARVVEPPSTPEVLPDPRSSSGFTADAAGTPSPRRTPLPKDEPVPARASSPKPRPRPASSLSPTMGRVAPQGVDPDGADAYEALPITSRDRSPVGGIGSSGIHVDRIGMGSAYARGICDGPDAVFSVRDHGQAHVCFRVVHERQPEWVTVLWEHDGETIRRARIRVPARHGYRTRAGIGLRRAFLGHWQVNVVDAEGTLLAQQEFDIVN